MRSSSQRTSTDSSSHTRSALRRWLEKLGGRDDRMAKRSRLLLETLETRQLLAGDVELSFTDGAELVSADPAAETTSTLRATSEAEGELAPDLVAFAQALSDEGVRFYGAAWCGACTLQKEIFQDGANELTYVEVSNPDRSQNELGDQLSIASYPTWIREDGGREEGVLTLQQLSTFSGVEIPQSETPRFETIDPQTVGIGSPKMVTLDVYDPDGGAQTVTVSVDDPDLVTAEVLTGNRSLRIDMETYGDMVFELFEQRAPRATGRLIELAEADFYNDIIFHRIVDNFVIQGGDPTGTGTSGSDLGTFDDDFHPELQHNRTGVLSWAKSSDDTNNSQFFITEVATRSLDYNHSIAGQLVEGDDVREAISEHAFIPADPDNLSRGGTPTIPIRIESVEVFSDIENSVVMLMPTGNATGSTNVTFTVTDPDGNTYSQDVRVDVTSDIFNGQPYLNEVNVGDAYPINTPATVQLSSTDVEGDLVEYFVDVQPVDAVAAVDSTGLLTVTPTDDFSGEVVLRVGVRPGPGVSGNGINDMDTQVIRLNFEGEPLAAPTSIDLLTGGDSGISNIDNITREETLTFTVAGVADGATVEIVLVATGAVVGFGTGSGGSATITTNNLAALGDGSYELVARQRTATQASDNSSPLTVVYDSTSPESVADSAVTRANVGVEYDSDLISNEEGGGLRYAIVSGPAGAVINSATGLITWTPTAQQTGQNSFTVQLTDAAGNSRTDTFDVEVGGDPLVAVKLQLTDLDGSEISSVQVGQEFLLNLIGVDARNAFDRAGVYGIFADILFDSSLVQPASVPIDYAPDFPALNSGTFLDGEIDELGATSSRTVASNERESLIATVRMEAIGTGSVNFLSEPAEAILSEMLLFGIDEEIDDAFVEYRSVGLAIDQSYIVRNDTASVVEDSGTTVIDVLGNDEVVQGSTTLSVISVTPPAANATVELQDGEVVFTPDDDFNGNVEFTYRVTDTNGVQENGTVTVTVTPVNDPPTGTADRFDVTENTTENSLDVLDNDDDDPDSGETLTINKVTGVTPGATVTIGTGGQVVLYTPPPDFTGTDTFSYTVSDGGLESDVEVTVVVAPLDPPPTANDDAFDVDEDDAEAEFDLLSNDQRDDSDEAFVLDSAQANQGGSVRISQDGTQFFYAPAADFFGTEEVTYTIRDTGGGIATATATFTVAGSNDPPPAVDLPTVINRGSGESVVLRISDLPDNVDGDGETLSFANLGTPDAGGSVRIDENGNIIYTPPADSFVGADTFSYEVQESGSDLTSSGTITVDVTDLIRRDIIIDAALQDLPVIDGIRLVGKNALGEDVVIPLLYQNGSSPRFDDVLPGEYRVEIPAIPFFLKAQEPQIIPLVTGPDDGDTTISPDLGRLRPEYISIRSWLGSASREVILVAVSPGSDSLLSSPSPTAKVRTITNPIVSLDEDGSRVSITGETPAGGLIETEFEIPTTADPRVQKLGERDGVQLYKIIVEDVAFVDKADATPPGESTGGEGEQILSATSNLTVGGGGAEGELITSGMPEELREERSLEASVDVAMQDVAEQLTLVSPTAEALAVADDQQADLGDSAVDAALSSQL